MIKNNDNSRIFHTIRRVRTALCASILAVLLGIQPAAAFAADVSGGNGGQGENSKPVIVIPQPILRISSRGAEGILSAGQEFLTEITIKNKGVVAVERPVVTLAPSGNITAVGNTNSSYEVKDIKPGESQTITLRWKLSDSPSPGTNEIGVAVKFYYNNGSGLSQGTDEGKILLSSNGASQTIDGATPNVIIQSFEYGGETVAAGEEFQLDVTVLNTSSVRKIENLVVTAEMGDGLNISSSSNVFYIKALGTGKEQSVSLPLQVSPVAKNTAANVTFQFKYEYVDHDKRSQVSSSQTVSVPIFQKDRFTILETVLPNSPVAGEEQNISIKYVNQGKGDVSNVKAELKDGSEEGENSGRVQYLGNFEPGKSGAINFLVTPGKPGKNEYKAVITYEDANMKEQQKEIDISFEAAEGMPAAGEGNMDDMMMPEKGGSHGKAIAAGAGILAAVLGGILVIVTVKKKRSRAKGLEELDFDDDTFDE